MKRVTLCSVLIVFVASGCASIPLSTAFKLSSLTPQRIAQIDPAEVRVRVSVPIGFELDVAKTELSLVTDDDPEVSMGLMLLGTNQDSRDGGFFQPDTPVSTYLMSLDGAGSSELRKLQSSIVSRQLERIAFTVNTNFATLPEGAEEITFWVDLRLSNAEPFILLIDGATIEIENDAG